MRPRTPLWTEGYSLQNVIPFPIPIGHVFEFLVPKVLVSTGHLKVFYLTRRKPRKTGISRGSYLS